MMPAAKHFDPLLGIDIHLIQPPGGVPPVPIPHPHIGMVFDPMDYVPILGATVLVGGVPRAQAGTSGIALPPHIPMGGVFIKPPANESEVFMGSTTVSVDGDAFSYLSLPALSCQDIGMPPIPRRKKTKTTKSLVLPTTMVLSIPVPVVVGGAPTISRMALGMRAGMAVLGALVSKLKKMRAARKSQNGVHCNGGHPVDVITGANFDEFVDSRSAPPGLFCWRRRYTTAHADRQGGLGWGFRHEYQHTLRLLRQAWRYEDARGRVIDFAPLNGDERETKRHGVVLRRLDGRRYEIAEGRAPRLILQAAEGEEIARLRFVRSAEAELELLHEGERLSEVTERTQGERCLYRFVYDIAGRLTEVLRVHSSGTRRVARYEYDRHGHLVVSEDAESGRHEYQYDQAHRWTRMRTPTGFSFWWCYDAQGRCTETSGEDGLWWARFEYAPDNQESRVTERRGGISIFQYDKNLTLRKRIDPYGGILVREVDAEGRVLREVDPGGRVTQMVYDAHGALVGRVDPYQRMLPPPEEMPRPRPPDMFVHPRTPLGHMMGRGMDELPRAALGASRTLLCRLPAALSEWITLLVRLRPEDLREEPQPVRTHDSQGRLVREVDTAGRKREWHYDPAGNEVWYRDADGRVRERRISRWNLVTEEVDGLGHTTHYEYSSTEQVTRTVDPGGSVSEYEYDEKDRLIRIWRHGTLKEEYVWNAGDRLVEKRDGHGQILMRIEHGPQGHTSTRHLASGGRHLLAWDERGRPIRASTESYEVRLLRDTQGRMLCDLRDGRGTEHIQSPSARHTLVLGRFTWKQQGNKEEGDLLLVDPTGGHHRLSREPTGLVLREHANGARELRQYDDVGRLRSSLIWKPTHYGAYHSRWVRYDYTPEGDLDGFWDSIRGQTRYATDPAHRLVQEEGPRGRALYRLDAAGNLQEKPGLGNVVLAEGNRLASANGETLTYDHRNHLRERRSYEGPSTRYTYDSADMLVCVEDGRAEPWTAEYDAIGRRLRCGRGARQTHFYWDGERLAAEVSPEGRLRLYGYAAHDALVPLLFVDYDSTEASPESGRVYTLYTNQAGVPDCVEDASGRVVWWAERIDPYGHVEVAPSSGLELNLRWPGHYLDTETGLFYNRFRYYDPVLGRYLQSDPLGLDGGINLYAYAPNPLVQFDVLGLSHQRSPSSSKTQQDPVEHVRAKYGDEGVGTYNSLLGDRMAPHLAKQTLEYADEMGILREVRELVDSGKLENLRGLNGFLKEIRQELKQDQQGKLRQFHEAHQRAMKGNEVAIEGRRKIPADPRSGQADIVDHTQEEALQMKVVTGAKEGTVIGNLQSAVDQLGGSRGEFPPDGYKRIADIRIEAPNNPLNNATEHQLRDALRGRIANLDNLDAGEVHISNTTRAEPYVFTPDQLKPD
ncbi:RHS repeat-associated core domain-containing protein [Cystobacter fuscus]|uniref:RHS repeat-associated core domain-containing protein n=1 Tax=Cystobacter fuscus TaxID=43 RepID=UPI0037C03852